MNENRPPFFYDYSNVVTTSTNPSTVHVRNNKTFEYFKRYLLKRAISVFDFKLPTLWDANYFMYTLFVNGFISVLNVEPYGVICQQCGLMGYNLYYNPTQITVSNPNVTGIINRTIGADCAVIKLQPDYSGVMDIVEYFSAKLALLSEALDMNMLNSKLAYLFYATNKRQAESFKKLFDNVMSGEPAVIVDTALKPENGEAINAFANNLKQNYITPEMLSDMRTLLNEFDSMIGLPNANTQKRERMITDEVLANDVETKSLSALWLETIKVGMESANRIFPGLNLNVEWRFTDDETSNTVDSRSIPLRPDTV